jgi:hypothetical protein
MKAKIYVFIISTITGIFIGAYITNLYFEKNEPAIEYLEPLSLDSLFKHIDSTQHGIEYDSTNYSEELYSDYENPFKITPFPYIRIYLACFPPQQRRLYKSRALFYNHMVYNERKDR